MNEAIDKTLRRKEGQRPSGAVFKQKAGVWIMTMSQPQGHHTQTEVDAFGRWTEAMRSGAEAASQQHNAEAIQFLRSALDIALDRNARAESKLFSCSQIAGTAECMVDVMISIRQFNQATTLLSDIPQEPLDSVFYTEFLAVQYQKIEVAERVYLLEPNFYRP